MEPRPRHRAQSLVELALLLPVVLLLLAGIIDIGRAIYFTVQVTDASEQAARVAVLPDRICNTLVGKPGTCSGAGNGGQTVCGAAMAALPGVPSGSVNCGESGTLTPGASPGGQAYVEVDQFTTFNATNPCSEGGGTYTTATPRAPGNLPIRVQIDFYFQPITPLLSNLFAGSFHLHGQACERGEY